MTDREIFKKNFCNLINLTKVKQVDIAKYVGCSYQTVSAWATGRGYPRVEQMEALCKFFGVKLSALTEKPKVTNEDRLVDAFRSLSATGRKRLLEYAKELTIIYPMGKAKGETDYEKK